jgi:hypothetical protein
MNLAKGLQLLRDAGLDPWGVAIHEAAHAVIAWKLHVPVKRAAICNFERMPCGGVSAGSVRTPGCDDLVEVWAAIGRGHRKRRHALNATAMVMLAGEEAELQIIGEIADPFGAHNDEKLAGKIIEELIGRTTDIIWDPDDDGYDPGAVTAHWRHYNRLREMTRRLVRHHARTIKRVAENLLARGALGFDEIVAIVVLKEGEAP